MTKPSIVLAGAAAALFAFAAGLYLGAHCVVQGLDGLEFEATDDARVPVAIAWMGARYSTAYAWQISSLGVVALTSAAFAKAKCETTSEVKWIRLLVFVVIAVAVTIGAMVAFVLWRANHAGMNC